MSVDTAVHRYRYVTRKLECMHFRCVATIKRVFLLQATDAEDDVLKFSLVRGNQKGVFLIDVNR